MDAELAERQEAPTGRLENKFPMRSGRVATIPVGGSWRQVSSSIFWVSRPGFSLCKLEATAGGVLQDAGTQCQILA